ncbi:MAG: RNA 2',3'-cyclic phosphodiesterase [bacterium]
MRTFIAINIPERSKDLIENKINLIKQEVKQDIKWVKKENWHITLKFLGEIRKNKVNNIKQRLSLLKFNNYKFPIKFQGINAFPDLNHPKVLFVKINQGYNCLTEIYQKIESQMEKEGFSPEDRKYTPHLTIARSRKNTDLKKLSNVYNKFTDKYFINVFMKAVKISLMKSELYPEGPKYKKIFDISLKNA